MADEDNASTLPLTDVKAAEVALMPDDDNKGKAPETQDSKSKEATAQAPKSPETDKTEWEWPAEFVAEHPELAGKFKDLEALARSYANLESEFTKSRQGAEPDKKETVTPEKAQEDAKAFFERFVEDPKKALSELFLPEIRSTVSMTLALNEAWSALVGQDATLATDEKLNVEMEKMVPAIAQMILSGTPVKEALQKAVGLIRGAKPALSEKEIREKAREEARQDILGTKGESGKTGAGSPAGKASETEAIVGEILGATKPALKLTSR